MSNFDFLKSKWPDLGATGRLAEEYLYSDPNAAIFKTRLFAEKLIDLVLVVYKIHLENEQKRIAAILDKADAVRRKRQETIRLLDEFLRSVFLEMYQYNETNKNIKDYLLEKIQESGRGTFSNGPFGSDLLTSAYGFGYSSYLYSRYKK